MTFTVAIVGRPNVGKSTLFNRLIGQRLALVDDAPGVTRDRREGAARIADLRFTVFDTAGLEEAADDTLAARMTAQSEAAVAMADVCLLLIDARAGVTPADAHFATLLRRMGKPVLLAANKCEGKAGQAALLDAYALGFGEPIALSAEHGEGLDDLYEALLPYARAADSVQDEAVDDGAVPADGDNDGNDPDRPLRVAVVGRPNVGKSTLINRLLGEERLLTGPEAGITRDTIAIERTFEGRKVKLFDTAGMRRKSRVAAKVEKLSVADTLRAIKFAEVVVVVMDAGAPFEKQDLQIVDLVTREGRALVLAINKWDQVDDKRARLFELEEQAQRLLPQVRGVALVTLSAKTGQRLSKLMPAVFDAAEVWNRRVTTGALNRWLEEVVQRHPPPAAKGRRVRLRYATQAKARPPTFILFSSRANELPTAYARYLTNALREDFDLWGTPVRIQFRKGDNPYANN